MECTVATENVSCYCLQSKLTTPFSILIDNHTLHSVKYEFYLLSLQNQDKKTLSINIPSIRLQSLKSLHKEGRKDPWIFPKKQRQQSKAESHVAIFFFPHKKRVSY